MKVLLTIPLFFSVTLGQALNATMTLYKDGSVLIKQPVAWQVPAGVSTVHFDLLPAGLVEDSPFLTLQNATLQMQRLEREAFSSEQHLQYNLGRKVAVKVIGGGILKGRLLEINSHYLTLQRWGRIISIERERIGYVRSRKTRKEHRYRPLLSWEIEAPQKGVVQGELIYLARGFDWNAIYRLILDRDGDQAELVAEAYISNHSTLDFPGLNLQFVEGYLQRQPLLQGSASGVEARAEREPLGDFHVYTLPDLIVLKGNQNVTVRLYDPARISYRKTYLFENSEQSQREEPLAVEYRIDNSAQNNLNIPLPSGVVEIYQNTTQGTVEYLGEDRIGQVPKGETAEIIGGRAFDVIGRRRVLNYDRQRKSEEGTIEIEVTNTRKMTIQVRLIEHITGDWVIRGATENYIKKDASTIHFPLEVPAGGSRRITYTYRKEWN